MHHASTVLRSSSRRAVASAAVCGLALSLGSFARASGTAEYAIVVIDPTNPASLRVGHHYIAARNIPESNVIYMKSGASNYAEFVNTAQKAFQSTIATRNLADHADYAVIAPTDVYFLPAAGLVSDGCFPVESFSIGSVYAMSFISTEVLAGTDVSLVNQYSSSSDFVTPFDSNNRYLNGSSTTSLAGRRYYIGAYLGWTGANGNTPEQLIEMINRSVAVDGTRPPGTFYYMNNPGDPARNVRQPGYGSAVTSLVNRGFAAQQLAGILPTNRTDCLGIMTGTTNPPFDSANIALRPGSFCDHLTSFAGNFSGTGQTPMSEWIARGASGTAGTVYEPCNYLIKFPSPRLHVWYAQGLSLGESYFRSLAAVPFQNLFIGDPLTRPWAYIPVVTAAGLPATGTPVTGDLIFTPNATSANPINPPLTIDVLVDGVLRSTVARGTPVTIDTRGLDDGWHDLRILARDGTAVRSIGRLASSFVTANNFRSATITPSATSGDLASAFDFTVAGAGGQVREVRIVSNSRVLAAGQAGTPLRVFASTLGGGTVKVRADVVFADNRVCRTAPVTVTIAPTGTPVATAPVAFSTSKILSAANTTYVVELPASVSGDPALATYTLLSAPAGITVIPGTGPYRFVTTGAAPSAPGVLTFQVQNGAGTSNVGTIALAFTAPSICAADYNADGSLNPDDLADYIGSYFNTPPDPAADFNRSGSVDPDDLADMIGSFFAGC